MNKKELKAEFNKRFAKLNKVIDRKFSFGQDCKKEQIEHKQLLKT